MNQKIDVFGAQVTLYQSEENRRYGPEEGDLVLGSFVALAYQCVSSSCRTLYFDRDEAFKQVGVRSFKEFMESENLVRFLHKNGPEFHVVPRNISPELLDLKGPYH